MQAAPASPPACSRSPSDANLGAATAPLVLDGGTLRFDASFDPAATRPVSLGGLGGTIDTDGNTATFAQGIAGAGALTKTGRRHAHPDRRQQLFRRHHDRRRNPPDRQWRNHRKPHRRRRRQRQPACSTGRTRRPSAARSAAADRSTQAGTGTTVLTGTSSYTGGTIIDAGTLQIGNGGTTGSITGDVANNGTLAFDRFGCRSTFGGTISGAGAVLQAGTGTTDPHRRQQLCRRHDDRCRHAADRRRRDQPAA